MIEKMVVWYFTKQGREREYYSFFPENCKNPAEEAAKLIQKRYSCRDEDFNILFVQEVMYED